MNLRKVLLGLAFGMVISQGVASADVILPSNGPFYCVAAAGFYNFQSIATYERSGAKASACGLCASYGYQQSQCNLTCYEGSTGFWLQSGSTYPCN